MTASTTPEGGPEARVERTFPALDGLRAIAAFAVLVHHVSFWTGDHSADQGGRILARLDVGVPIFFVLSGFLLSRPIFLAAARDRRPPRPAAYLWRRALRILPAYWLTVVVALSIPPGDDVGDVGTWLRYLTLTQIYGPRDVPVNMTHTWSLATEAAFYLFLPLAGAALVALQRRCPARPAAVLVALGAATLAGFGWLVWIWAATPLPATAPDLWLPSFTGWFAAGMALAVLSVSDPGWRPVRMARDVGTSLPTCWLTAAALFWMATSTVAGPIALGAPSIGQAVTKNLLYLGVATFLLLPLVLADSPAGWTRQALASAPARYLGEISYGVFLVHVVVLAGAYSAFDWVPFTGNLVLVLMGTAVVSVAVAAAIYAGVERPLRRWRALVADHRDDGAGRSEATRAPTASSAST